MPRPTKCRMVCSLPKNNQFGPCGSCYLDLEKIIMTIDEYETIRLIDLENDTQEQCAEQMKIARTTVQSIYDQARKKIATAIVLGKKLVIEGGSYELCDGQGKNCQRGSCHRNKQLKREEENDETSDTL